MYKKNVALIIPSLRGGGAEKTVSRLSQQLSKRYNLYTIVFDNTDFKYEVKGKLIDLKLPYNQKITTKIYNFYKRFISLRRLKQKYKIGVSISFMEGPNLLNILSRVDDRVLISVRNYLSEDLSGPEAIYLPFIKPLYKRSDKIITVSHAVKYDLFKNFNIDLNQISTIYNFVDIKSIQNKCRQPINPLDEHIFKKDVIINMSRFTKQKGQIHLIKAFKYINQKKLDLNLVLLGEGPLYNSYQDLVKSLGLDKSIFFIPFKENPFPYLNRAKLYI
ncbi:MAG: glycosyltransferase, partial [Halanaerobiales bacterium]|nr:glycosyltransferase [Halanaerobiales bacterium]